MIRAHGSTVFSADTAAVWSYLRDFGNFAEWHPGSERSEMEDGAPGDQVGAIRRLSGPNGTFRERLVSLDDDTMTQVYNFVESPLPVHNLRGTIHVAAVTETEQTFVEWTVVCDVDDEAQRPKMEQTFLRGVIRPGLGGLGEHFS